MSSKQAQLFRFPLFLLFFISVTTKAKTQNCNTWLSVPSQPSFVRVGDLDVPGNKITVEATFNRTAAWSGADVFQGDLVSKHEDQTDCNYLLRPSSAEITTTNGYFKTPTICPIQLNKTYHVAMVYDGTVLKFYRNGFLMSQIAASGNLILNNWQTQIGLYFNQITKENFIGYINEVRIWNIVRSRDQINTYMNQSLPSPNTQSGLLAYYTFDNLINKQGNNTWNGSLHGTASINKVNPNCTFLADSCDIPVCIKPKIDVRLDTTVCQGSTVVLSTNSNGATSFLWQPSIGLDNASSPNPIASPSKTTKYIVTASNGLCESKDSITITINDLPAILLTKDTTICSGANVQLQASGGVEYKWSPSTGLSTMIESNPISKPSNTISYKVNVKGANGCSKEGVVTISVIPKSNFQLAPYSSSICLGTSISLNAIGGDTFQWFSQSGRLLSNSNTLTISPDTSTVYKVLFSDSKCLNSDSIYVPIIVNPKINPSITKSNEIDCSNGEVQLIASGGTNYEWFPTNGLSNPMISNPIASPSLTTKYYVTVRSSDGCSALDSTTVNVSSGGAGGLHIPSAFTPNNDSKNDCFSIKKWTGIKEFSLEIYNRWGEKVFYSKTLPFCWNGTYKGVVQPGGVFVYQVKAKTICGDIYKKGTITLLR